MMIPLPSSAMPLSLEIWMTRCPKAPIIADSLLSIDWFLTHLPALLRISRYWFARAFRLTTDWWHEIQESKNPPLDSCFFMHWAGQNKCRSLRSPVRAHQQVSDKACIASPRLWLMVDVCASPWSYQPPLFRDRFFQFVYCVFSSTQDNVVSFFAYPTTASKNAVFNL